MATLSIDKITKAFGSLTVIPELSLTIEDGEFCVLVGPSGCGKSTLLRIIAGLEPISSGCVLVDGADMSDAEPPERGVAMVFQSYALYPHMNVARNIGFGLEIARTPAAEIGERVGRAAGKLKLSSYLKRKPRELSGGQRQRVAIGRAIVRHPQVFLFDEPLSNLDAELRVHMRIEIARLHKELATTIIYVTHDQVEAMTLADKIVVLRDGAVAQVGSPLTLYDDPDNLFVAGFIGSPKMNFLKGIVEGGVVRLPEHGNQTIPLAAKAANGSEVTVGLRPEYFKAGGASHLDLTVEMVEHLGSESYAYARYGEGDLLTIATQNDRDVRAGSRLSARFDPARALLFDPAGQRIR
jgi:lactose/L-arabinose transport system ATP-binding protein